MSTSPKRAAAVAVKRGRKKVTDPGAMPFLRFRHSQELRAKTIGVLETVEGAERAADHSDELAALILELTDCGMDQYFLQPLKAAKANFLVQQSAALGLAGVKKVMGTVLRNIVGRMDDRQLLSVCDSIRRFMA